MENPAVFTSLADKLGEIKMPIICTYGQIKLSAIILIKLLEKECEKIYYSGDIDPEGIQIADKIKSLFPSKIQLIGYDENTYYKNISDVTLSPSRLEKLNKIKNEELIEISNIVKKEKRASYEELKIENLYIQIAKHTNA